MHIYTRPQTPGFSVVQYSMTIAQDLKRSLTDDPHNLHLPCKRFHPSSRNDSFSDTHTSNLDKYNTNRDGWYTNKDAHMVTCGSEGATSRRDSGAVCNSPDDMISNDTYVRDVHTDLHGHRKSSISVRHENSIQSHSEPSLGALLQDNNKSYFQQSKVHNVNESEMSRRDIAKAARRVGTQNEQHHTKRQQNQQPQQPQQHQIVIGRPNHSISTDEFATLLCRAEPTAVSMNERDLYNEWVFNSANSYTPSQIRWLQKHQPSVLGNTLDVNGGVVRGISGNMSGIQYTDGFGSNVNNYNTKQRQHGDTDEVLRRQVARFGSKLRTTQSNFL